VIAGSLLPGSSPVIRFAGNLPVSTKTLHFCAYAWLALLALFAVERRPLAVLAAFAMILLGIALEFGQRLVPGRSFELRDMLINSFGVLTGIVIGILAARMSSASSQQL
jgi:VanZ family protein